jgi:hypothetical protein
VIFIGGFLGAKITLLLCTSTNDQQVPSVTPPRSGNELQAKKEKLTADKLVLPLT